MHTTARVAMAVAQITCTNDSPEFPHAHCYLISPERGNRDQEYLHDDRKYDAIKTYGENCRARVREMKVRIELVVKKCRVAWRSDDFSKEKNEAQQNAIECTHRARKRAEHESARP